MEKANIRKVTWVQRLTRENKTNMKKANIKYVKFYHSETKMSIECRFDTRLRTEDEIIAMLRGLMREHEYSTYWSLEKVEIA